jgi:hypothetical protein
LARVGMGILDFSSKFGFVMLARSGSRLFAIVMAG